MDSWGSQDILAGFEPADPRSNRGESVFDLNSQFTAKGAKNARDKKLHHVLLCATPSVWGNPTEMCVSGNAEVQSSQDNMEEFKRLI